MPKINLGKVVGDKGEPFTFNDFTTEQLDGITPKILKGNVTTLDPDENAIVDIRKDGINNYIDFGIPRGKNGSELKDVSSENVVMADKTTLESTMTTVNENVSANSDEINKIKSPTFNDTVSTYSTLNDANTAAETTSNAIKNKVSIFTTLSNIKKSFSAIVQGLKILGTNVGAITGITSDLAGESETVAASIKAVNALNSKLGWKNAGRFTGDTRFELPLHKELFIIISLQSNRSYARTLHIANAVNFQTNVFGVSNGSIDYVEIFYHQSAIGMRSTSNPLGIVNFAVEVFYR